MTSTINRSDYLKPAQSGLWAHSHNAETDLMKQFVVERVTPSGHLALASYDQQWEAELHLAGTVGDHRIWDQINDEDVTAL